MDAASWSMFVRGVSTAGVAMVMAARSGIRPSPATVARVCHSLQAECEAWQKRQLKAHYL